MDYPVMHVIWFFWVDALGAWRRGRDQAYQGCVSTLFISPTPNSHLSDTATISASRCSIPQMYVSHYCAGKLIDNTFRSTRKGYPKWFLARQSNNTTSLAKYLWSWWRSIPVIYKRELYCDDYLTAKAHKNSDRKTCRTKSGGLRICWSRRPQSKAHLRLCQAQFEALAVGLYRCLAM